MKSFLIWGMAISGLIISTHPTVGARESCYSEKEKEEKIANTQEEIRMLELFMDDEDKLLSLVEEYKEFGQFKGDKILTVKDMKQQVRDSLQSQLISAKSRLSGFRQLQVCSEHGAQVKCINNKQFIINQSRETIRLGDDMLGKPLELVMLTDQLLQAGQLRGDYSHAQKIVAAKKFIGMQKEAAERKISEIWLQPECSH